MSIENISSAITSLLDDFLIIQKDPTQVRNLYSTVITEAEIAVIKKALFVSKNNKTRAALMLGMSRTTLLTKIKSLKIEEDEL
jgi:DNA-binding protein Fis